MTAFTRLDELEPGTVIDADVAIVGTGAAGIAIARELSGTRLDVVLLESGDLDLDGATQALYEGGVVGMPYVPLETCRTRCFGGTTNQWTGWCKPFAPIDLAPRPWLGLKGWPIDHDELLPYYHRAQPVMGLGEYRYDRSLWDRIGQDLHAFDPDKVTFSFWQHSPGPARFGTLYRADLERAGNVRILLDANVVNIQADPAAGRVEHLQLRSLAGREARIRARFFVLACGGIENARLLLVANDVRPAGLGNDHDQVGRCFMEHPLFSVGEIVTDDPYGVVDRYHRRKVDGVLSRIGLSLAPATQERLGLANSTVVTVIERDSDGVQSQAARLWHELWQGTLPDHPTERAYAILRELDAVAMSAWRKLVHGTYVNKPPRSIRLGIFLDPLPNPSSRVTLGEDRDALGQPRVMLDWRLLPEDARGAVGHVQLVAAEMARLGIGRVRLNPALADAGGAWMFAGNLEGYDLAPGMPEMHVSLHHMGTTRMSARPEDGVVDGNCRLHGVDNLYLAGSSVFPTGSNGNPTFTIAAMSLRLADHLIQRSTT
jgi:choline dehydrogenase-like flavoprotein